MAITAISGWCLFHYIRHRPGGTGFDWGKQPGDRQSFLRLAPVNIILWINLTVRVYHLGSLKPFRSEVRSQSSAIKAKF